MTIKKLTGIVISNKLLRTVTVRVNVLKKDPKYGKAMRFHKKFLADVALDQKLKIGDRVTIAACRPLSTRKYFKVVEVKSI